MNILKKQKKKFIEMTVIKYKEIKLEFVPHFHKAGARKLSFDSCIVKLKVVFGNALDRVIEMNGVSFENAEKINELMGNPAIALLHSRGDNQKVKVFADVKTSTLLEIIPESNWEEYKEFVDAGWEHVKKGRELREKESKLIEKFYNSSQSRRPNYRERFGI